MKQLAALIALTPILAFGQVMSGDKTITEAEQAHVNEMSDWREPFPWGGEWCYFRNGKAVNFGWCRNEPVPVPKLPAGKRTRSADYVVVEVPTLPGVWRECERENVFGCTKGQPLVVYVYGGPGANRVLAHEIEYHVYRSIEH